MPTYESNNNLLYEVESSSVLEKPSCLSNVHALIISIKALQKVIITIILLTTLHEHSDPVHHIMATRKQSFTTFSDLLLLL